MKIDEVKLLYDYYYWANQRIRTACANVTQDQYVAATEFGTLRAIMIHLLDAEWVWRLTVQGTPVDNWQELTEVQYPTFDVLKDQALVEEQAMRAYLDTLSDERLDGIVSYPISGGIIRQRVLWHCLVHVVNHGTQHRSEAAALLTSYGQSPGDLDFTVYLNERFKLPS